MRVLIARVARGNWERCEVGTWLAQTFMKAKADRRITFFNSVVIDKCPTDAARNELALYAQRLKYDALFSIDNDNVPAPDDDFFTVGIDYLLRYPAGVLASPYCGARTVGGETPDREVQVVVKDPAVPEGRRRVTREEAATLTGIQPAYGVGTVLAIGVKVFDLIPPPWWAYRYFDPHHTLAGTEDFTFSEAVVDAGGRVDVAWGNFCGHAKQEVIGRPSFDKID